MYTILVSGATGFLGSYLVRRFVAEGYRVVALVREHSDLHRLAAVSHQLQIFNIEHVPLNLLFQNAGRIDAVVHTATTYGRASESLSQLVDTNVLWGLRLLETAVENEVTCFINSGSALSAQTSPYARSKQQFVEWGNELAERRDIGFINVKLEHMYGADDDINKFTTHVIKSCLCNVAHLALTAGEQQRDFVYIDDVVDAYVCLARNFAGAGSKIGFREYPLGSGHAVTVQAFVKAVHTAANSKTALEFGTIPYRANEPMFSQADLTELHRLGWQPRTDIHEGIQRTVAWYASHLKGTSS